MLTRATKINASNLARKIEAAWLKAMFSGVQQRLVNASIDLPEYSDPDFRLINVNEAIEALTRVKSRLEAESALNKMKSASEVK